MTRSTWFHTSGSEDGDKVIYHHQVECDTGQPIIRNGNKIDGSGMNRSPCDRCVDLGGSRGWMPGPRASAAELPLERTRRDCNISNESVTQVVLEDLHLFELRE